MFENIMKFFKKVTKKENDNATSKDTAKERLHLVLVQDRANVSADFLELMKQEIIEVIKKYIEIDEDAIDVHLTNKENIDGTNGSPALYANIPIVNVKDETRKLSKTNTEDKVIKTDVVEENEVKIMEPENEKIEDEKAADSTTTKKSPNKKTNKNTKQTKKEVEVNTNKEKEIVKE